MMGIPLKMTPLAFFEATRATSLFKNTENGKISWKCTNLKPLLSIDVGSYKTGIAISSIEQQLPVLPWTTLYRTGFNLDSKSKETWIHTWKRFRPAGIIVGNPLSLSTGKCTINTVKILEFVMLLSDLVSNEIPAILLWDERYTTRNAKTNMKTDYGDKYHSDIDQFSAKEMLEEYISLTHSILQKELTQLEKH